jgi:hypothetical protein
MKTGGVPVIYASTGSAAAVALARLRHSAADSVLHASLGVLPRSDPSGVQQAERRGHITGRSQGRQCVNAMSRRIFFSPPLRLVAKRLRCQQDGIDAENPREVRQRLQGRLVAAVFDLANVGLFFACAASQFFLREAGRAAGVGDGDAQPHQVDGSPQCCSSACSQSRTLNVKYPQWG